MYLPAGDQPDFTAPLPPRGITPDIIVTTLGIPKRKIAIEVESDIDFDPEKALRQIKNIAKYSRRIENPKRPNTNESIPTVAENLLRKEQPKQIRTA